jgi:hypothetical protein
MYVYAGKAVFKMCHFGTELFHRMLLLFIVIIAAFVHASSASEQVSHNTKDPEACPPPLHYYYYYYYSEYVHRLYITLVKFKLEYASVVWNSTTSTDDKLELIQQRFAALCLNHFFPQAHYCYSLALEELKLHTLRMRRHRLDAFFLIQVVFSSYRIPDDGQSPETQY